MWKTPQEESSSLTTALKKEYIFFFFLNFTDILFQEMQAKQISNKLVIYNCIKQIGCKIFKNKCRKPVLFFAMFSKHHMKDIFLPVHSLKGLVQ